MLKILLLHKDPKVIQMYEPHLKNHFLLDSAQNGLLGLRKMRLTPPSLVVSDYDLPLLSGPALLKFMRNSRQMAFTPFIFLTDHPNVAEGLSLGANDWILQSGARPDLVIEKIYHHLKLNPYGLQIH